MPSSMCAIMWIENCASAYRPSPDDVASSTISAADHPGHGPAGRPAVAAAAQPADGQQVQHGGDDHRDAQDPVEPPVGEQAAGTSAGRSRS